MWGDEDSVNDALSGWWENICEMLASSEAILRGGELAFLKQHTSSCSKKWVTSCGRSRRGTSCGLLIFCVVWGPFAQEEVKPVSYLLSVCNGKTFVRTFNNKINGSSVSNPCEFRAVFLLTQRCCSCHGTLTVTHSEFSKVLQIQGPMSLHKIKWNFLPLLGSLKSWAISTLPICSVQGTVKH